MGDIDFSNEGLSGRVESEGVDGVEATEADVVEDQAGDEAASTDDEQAVGDAPVEGDEDDARDLPAVKELLETEQVVEPEPDAYETRYQEAQKLIGRQGQELGELRKQVEAMMAQAQRPEPEAPVFPGRTPQSPQELYEMAADPNEAVDAYNFAIEKAPEHALQVINEVAQSDPILAEEMRAHYYQQANQPAEPAIPADMAQWWESQRQAAVVDQIAKSIEGFDEMREDIAKIVEEEPDLMGDGSPDAIAKGLRWAARMAQQVRHNATTQVQWQTQREAQQRRLDAVVESGTPSSAPEPVEHTEADSIRGAIFAQDKVRTELF